MARKRYRTDLSDAQWKRIAPLIPPAKPGGRPRTIDMREVMIAIFDITRTGCGWRMLPHDFPSGERCTSSTPAGGTTAPGRP
ncbi:MAG: transposase [Planctomycetaceae bacterium]|nr:transposase [Planctomycetaceae bacterium]